MPRINMIIMATTSEESHADFLKSFEDKGFITLPFETPNGVSYVTLQRITGMV